MARPKLDLPAVDDADKEADLLWQSDERHIVVLRTQQDLYAAATDLGQTQNQAETKIDELFVTFASSWNLYILTGSPAIIAAIQNDATLPWLDAEYPPGSGVTIRQRLINRLS